MTVEKLTNYSTVVKLAEAGLNKSDWVVVISGDGGIVGDAGWSIVG